MNKDEMNNVNIKETPEEKQDRLEALIAFIATAFMWVALAHRMMEIIVRAGGVPHFLICSLVSAIATIIYAAIISIGISQNRKGYIVLMFSSAAVLEMPSILGALKMGLTAN